MTWLIPNILDVLAKCQYIELDASFQASYPYVYTVPQAIIQNEAIPLGFTLAPTERMELYKEFYDAISHAYPRYDFHWKIPILTDEGAALIAFAKKFHMEHYLCYKHLLFKFVQNTPLYFLVRRIIFSPTPERLEKITHSIQMTASLIFQTSTAHQEAFEYIFQWQYNHQNHQWTQNSTNFSQQSLWVRNEKGIGTTTNHAESFHRTMNINTKKDDTPQKKTMNFRNTIVRKIKRNHMKSGRQIQEFIVNEQKQAVKKNITQVETCQKCDTSRFKARFLCEVPCLHSCLAYDITKIPKFSTISMKSTRENMIHTITTEDNWTFAATRGISSDNIEIEPIDVVLENHDHFEEIDFVIYECSEILHLKKTEIKIDFIHGAYAMYLRDHRKENKDQVDAMFIIFPWDQAQLLQNGIFAEYLEDEKKEH
jgi:hypothetical protein